MLKSDASADDRGRRAGPAGLDGAALKPAECDVRRARKLPFESVTIDYEGHEHVPDADLLASLAGDRAVRVTVPVRADGFDPLGDDSALQALPGSASRAYVAGHPAYLAEAERRRAVSPRLAAALAGDGDAWVGTEGIERAALATGATQFELLSGATEREFRALRAAGFDGGLAVYAPTVLTDDTDEVLDAVGSYVARRRPVADALPEGTPTDAGATGRAREVLAAAAREYALVGTSASVRARVERLREAGADHVVGYPARGLAEFLE